MAVNALPGLFQVRTDLVSTNATAPVIDTPAAPAAVDATATQTATAPSSPPPASTQAALPTPVTTTVPTPKNPLTTFIPVDGIDNSGDPYTFYVDRVRPNFFVMHAYSDAAIYDTGKGLVVFDSMRPGFLGGHDGANIQTAIAALKSKGLIQRDEVVRVVTTHWHPDHVGNNDMIRAKYPHAEIWAARGTAARDGTPQNIKFFGAQLPGFGADFLPNTEVPKIDSLPGFDVRVVHFPDSHTTTDLVAYIHSQKIVVLGDLALAGNFAFTDNDNGGTMTGLVKSLQTIVDNLGDDWRIVPGHGPVMSKKELAIYLSSLRQSTAYVGKKIAAGESLSDIQSDAKKDTAEGGLPNDVKALNGTTSTDPNVRTLGTTITQDAFLGFIYDDLTKRDKAALIASRELAVLKTVTGTQMVDIVLQATKKFQTAAATTEFDTLNLQVADLQAADAFTNPEASAPATKILSAKALAVFAVYNAAVVAARSAGQPGFDKATYAKLVADMRAVAR